MRLALYLILLLLSVPIQAIQLDTTTQITGHGTGISESLQLGHWESRWMAGDVRFEESMRINRTEEVI